MALETPPAQLAISGLVARQGYRNDQAVVSWAVSGKTIPSLFSDTYTLLDLDADSVASARDDVSAGQAFALRLARSINGYRAQLDPTEDVVVMALDSATPGRFTNIPRWA